MDRKVIRFRASRRLLRYLLAYSFCRTRYAHHWACRDSASAGLCGTTYEVMFSPSLERDSFDENPCSRNGEEPKSFKGVSGTLVFEMLISAPYKLDRQLCRSRRVACHMPAARFPQNFAALQWPRSAESARVGEVLSAQVISAISLPVGRTHRMKE
jgi:hypothetical protein